MVDEYNPKHGATIAIPLYKANITTGAANEDLALGGGGTLVVMPKAGSILGISLNSAGAITAGTITARAHKAGTEFAETGYPAPVVGSTAQQSYANARPRALRFAAGDKVGVSISSTTTLDPTNTLDVDAVLIVALDLD